MIDANDPRLTAYVLGELEDAERLEVEAAIESSRALQATVSEIRAAAESLEGYYRSELQNAASVAPAESFDQSVLAESDSHPGADRVAKAVVPRFRRKRVWALIASAAAICLLLAYLTSETVRSRQNGKVVGRTPSTVVDPADPQEQELKFSFDRARSERRELSEGMILEDPLSAIEGFERSRRVQERAIRPESNESDLDLKFSQDSFQSATPQFGGFDAKAAEREGYIRPTEGMTAGGDFIPDQPQDRSGGMGMGSGGAPMGGQGLPSGMSSGLASGGESMSAGGMMMGAPGIAGGMPPGMPGGTGMSAGRPSMASRVGSGSIDGDDATELEVHSHELLQSLDAIQQAGAPFDDPSAGDKIRVAVQRELASESSKDQPAQSQPADGRVDEGKAGGESKNEQGQGRGDSPLPAKEPAEEIEAKKNQVHEPQRTWRRSPATPNASQLMIGDDDGLPLEGMQANVVIDGFRARVLVDLYYYNDRQQQLEGSFKLRLPDEASPYYFAFGETSFEYRPQFDELASKGFFPTALVRESGSAPEAIRSLREASWANVKEARVVPREKAAHAYGETVRRRIDPALVEWAGAGVFNARVFPLAPQKLHRIVVGYDVNLRAEDGKLAFELALPKNRGECSVDLNVAVLPGAVAEVSPPVEPFGSSGRAFYHYAEPKGDTISLKLDAPGAIVLTGSQHAGNQAQAGDFFAARFTPELPKSEKQSGSQRAIFLVDTSLSSQPDRFNVWLKLLETTLGENREDLREFAVLFFNIDSHWYKPGYTANTPEAVDELLRYCQTLALEGATDIEQALAEAAAPSWLVANTEQPAPVDRFLFSDGAATWGETNLRQIAESAKSPLAGPFGIGPLFAYRTGFAGTDGAALDALARDSGGAVFSVVDENEIPQAAVAHRQRPYRLVAVETAGGGDFLTAGRVRSIYPGQSVLLVGRGKPTGEIVLKLSRGEETLEVKTPIAHSLDSDLAARIYGQTAVGQLEDLQAAATDVATAYARHFRVTGQTCSLLMLDSQADYDRFQIKPEDDAFVVKSTPAAEHIDHTLDAAASRLADPKAMWLDWIERMAHMPGGRFEASTALKVALEKLSSAAFAVAPSRIACSTHVRQDSPKKYFEELLSQQPSYETILAEAERRRAAGSADSLCVLSNLIETNPGDAALAKDVAFAAMELGLPGQAWPLLKRAALMRPYEPLVYQAMAQCLAEIGRADLAIVFYEIAVGGQWNERYRDVQRIAAVDYLRLLRQVESKKIEAQAADYAAARRASLEESVGLTEADLVVTLMWSTDRTDVDLHVVEPSGEECFYQHSQTRSGATITRDVTEGFGPEMYVAPKALHGKYSIAANFYGDDANRTTARTKVYVTICEGYGTPGEKVTRKTVLLSRGNEKREVATVTVEK